MTDTKPNVQEEIKKFLREQASKGGQETAKRHGTKHYSDIAKKRWADKRAGDKSTKPSKQ